MGWDARCDAALLRVKADKPNAGRLGVDAGRLRERADAPYRSTAGAVDPAVLEALGDEIVIMASHIHAITQRFLALIAEFDRLRGWERSGHRDCAQWLSVRTGIDRGAAQEKVRVARALVGLPLIREAMGRGELSFSKVRALTRKATP